MVLSLVLFLALPLSVLILVDHMRLQSEIRYEVKQLKKLKQEIKAEKEKENAKPD